jgi:hypothetical protein
MVVDDFFLSILLDDSAEAICVMSANASVTAARKRRRGSCRLFDGVVTKAQSSTRNVAQAANQSVEKVRGNDDVIRISGRAPSIKVEWIDPKPMTPIADAQMREALLEREIKEILFKPHVPRGTPERADDNEPLSAVAQKT